MKWEKCVRCGSNRVIKKSSGGIGIILGILGYGLIEIAQTLGIEGGAHYVLGPVLIGLGILLFFFSGKLFCKDCHATWRPSSK